MQKVILRPLVESSGIIYRKHKKWHLMTSWKIFFIIGSTLSAKFSLQFWELSWISSSYSSYHRKSKFIQNSRHSDLISKSIFQRIKWNIITILVTMSRYMILSFNYAFYRDLHNIFNWMVLTLSCCDTTVLLSMLLLSLSTTHYISFD